MSLAAWVATSPLRGLNALIVPRRSRSPLPRFTLSIGNIALGGRAKTPLVAEVCSALRSVGLRPAILSRGYGGRRSNGTRVLVGQGGSPAWAATVAVDSIPGGATAAARWGDEAAWLAATLPGVPVGVDPDRIRGARTVLQSHPTDVFVLDDGFQTACGRDLDVVVTAPQDRFGAATREGWGALERADLVLELGRDLHREPGMLRWIDGRPAEPEPATVVAGVGDPRSVEAAAAAAGIEVVGRRRLRDHGQYRGAWPRGTVLVTEKDALGWAADRGEPWTLVLGMSLRGGDRAAEQIVSQLPADLRRRRS